MQRPQPDFTGGRVWWREIALLALVTSATAAPAFAVSSLVQCVYDAEKHAADGAIFGQSRTRNPSSGQVVSIPYGDPPFYFNAKVESVQGYDAVLSGVHNGQPFNAKIPLNQIQPPTEVGTPVGPGTSVAVPSVPRQPAYLGTVERVDAATGIAEVTVQTPAGAVEHQKILVEHLFDPFFRGMSPAELGPVQPHQPFTVRANDGRYVSGIFESTYTDAQGKAVVVYKPAYNQPPQAFHLDTVDSNSWRNFNFGSPSLRAAMDSPGGANVRFRIQALRGYMIPEKGTVIFRGIDWDKNALQYSDTPDGPINLLHLSRLRLDTFESPSAAYNAKQDGQPFAVKGLDGHVYRGFFTSESNGKIRYTQTFDESDVLNPLNTVGIASVPVDDLDLATWVADKKAYPEPKPVKPPAEQAPPAPVTPQRVFSMPADPLKGDAAVAAWRNSGKPSGQALFDARTSRQPFTVINKATGKIVTGYYSSTDPDGTLHYTLSPYDPGKANYYGTVSSTDLNIETWQNERYSYGFPDSKQGGRMPAMDDIPVGLRPAYSAFTEAGFRLSTEQYENRGGAKTFTVIDKKTGEVLTGYISSVSGGKLWMSKADPHSGSFVQMFHYNIDDLDLETWRNALKAYGAP